MKIKAKLASGLPVMNLERFVISWVLYKDSLKKKSQFDRQPFSHKKKLFHNQPQKKTPKKKKTREIEKGI